MEVVSVQSIDYHILCDGKLIIESCNDSTVTILPRNYVPVNGIRATVTHLGRMSCPTVTKKILIPYSLQTISIFGTYQTIHLE
jgi:hypothetical protein